MQEFEEKAEQVAPVEGIPTEDASLKKFKNVKALEDAYFNLEKEFTKKCQQLSALAAKADDSISCAADSQQWNEKVDSFMRSYPIAKVFEGDIVDEMAALDGVEHQHKLDVALARVLSKNYCPPCEIIKDEKFLQEFVFDNAAIKGKIVEEYLLALANKKPPKTISDRGAIAITAPTRAKSLGEARDIAEGMLFNRRNF